MTAYSDFLSDPLHQSVYLAEVHYTDPTDGSAGVLYYSTGTYGTEAGDTPASQRFEARIAEGYNFSSGAGASEDGIGTVTGILPAREGGTLPIVQKLGDLDGLSAYAFDGRKIVIRHGGTSPRYGTLAYADFKEVFHGECNGQPLIGIDQVTFKLRNKDARFEHPIQTRKYRGGDWCLYFDGTGDYVSCGAHAAHNFTTSDFTLEFWILLEAYPGATERILNRGLTSVDGWAVRVDTSGQINIETYQAGATQTTTSTALTVMRWHHVAIVRDGAAATIYIDGVAANSASGTHINPTTSARNLYFGRNDGGTVFFQGFLDEIRLSNIARSRNEIVTKMNRQLTASEITASYVGYWKLDDGTGTNANDESASGADGTLTNAVWRPSLQGGEEQEGSYLPDVWGARYGVPPVLVDSTTRTYQVHSGPIQAIVGVYEGGAALTLDPAPGTTYTALSTFLAATTAATNYEVCSTDYGSWIRLGSNPQLPITVDLQGDKSGGTYRSKPSDIWRYIVANRGPQPLTDPDDIDDTAFDTAAAAVTAAVGIDYASEISIAEVGNFLLAGAGLTSWFQRDGGLLTIERFEGVSAKTAVLTLTEKDIELGTFEPLDAGSPLYQVDIGYKKNSLVHATSDIAGAVIGGTRWPFMMKEWRIASATDDSIREIWAGARKMSLETGFSLWSAASAEAHRRLALFASPPQAFRGFFRERATQLDRFNGVYLNFSDLDRLDAPQSRFGTHDAAAFLVLAAEDDTAKGGTWLTLYREAIA